VCVVAVTDLLVYVTVFLFSLSANFFPEIISV